MRFTGAEDHLVYLWDPSTVEGMPIWAFLLSSPGQATHMGTTVFCPSPLDIGAGDSNLGLYVCSADTLPKIHLKIDTLESLQPQQKGIGTYISQLPCLSAWGLSFLSATIQRTIQILPADPVFLLPLDSLSPHPF